MQNASLVNRVRELTSAVTLPTIISFPDFHYYSYKLWYNYLKLRRSQVRGRCITDPAYEEVNNTFERSIVFMHKVRFNRFVFEPPWAVDLSTVTAVV